MTSRHTAIAEELKTKIAATTIFPAGVVFQRTYSLTQLVKSIPAGKTVVATIANEVETNRNRNAESDLTTVSVVVMRSMDGVAIADIDVIDEQVEQLRDLMRSDEEFGRVSDGLRTGVDLTTVADPDILDEHNVLVSVITTLWYVAVT